MDLSEVFGKDAVDPNVSLRSRKRKIIKDNDVTDYLISKERRVNNTSSSKTKGGTDVDASGLISKSGESSSQNAFHIPDSLARIMDDDSLFLDIMKDTDTMIVLRSLRSEAKKYSNPPAILATHMYYFLKNKSIVEKELHDLVNEGKIRKFSAPTGPNEYCYIFIEDYKAYLKSLKSKFGKETAEMGAKHKRPVEKGICPKTEPLTARAKTFAFDRFEDCVITGCTDVDIHKERLVDLLYSVSGASRITNAESEIDLFILSGLLSVKNNASYWFVVPNCGKFFSNLSRGRQEVAQWLKKAPYKELLLSDLLKKKFKHVQGIPVHFIIEDLIGLNVIEKIDLSVGPLIKLSVLEIR